MSETITTEISTRICQHMNEDHADAVLLYARAYGNTPDAETAQMLSIDPQGMDLVAQINGNNIDLRIKFDRPLADAEDAHHTLIDLLKQARQKQA
jgi:putative heme iron utilization protein